MCFARPVLQIQPVKPDKQVWNCIGENLYYAMLPDTLALKGHQNSNLKDLLLMKLKKKKKSKNLMILIIKTKMKMAIMEIKKKKKMTIIMIMV